MKWLKLHTIMITGLILVLFVVQNAKAGFLRLCYYCSVSDKVIG